jgi:hypothetical protein
MSTTSPATRTAAAKGLATIVGFLVLVEFASGILQGYYTPIYPQIADHLAIHEPLGDYLTVWAVCAGASFLAALALMAAPRHAFSDTPTETVRP